MDWQRAWRLTLLGVLLLFVPTISGCDLNFGSPLVTVDARNIADAPIGSGMSAYFSPIGFLINVIVIAAIIGLLYLFIKKKNHDNGGLNSALVYLGATYIYYIPLIVSVFYGVKILPLAFSLPYLLPHLLFSLVPVLYLTINAPLLSTILSFVAVILGVAGAYWIARKWPNHRWLALLVYYVILIALGAIWWYVGIGAIDIP